VKILICDDHALFRDGLARVLGDLDPKAELLEADTAAEALERVTAHPELDLMLLDLQLPDADGFSVLDQVAERFPVVPVVVVSSSERPEDVRGALDRGALGFIPKSTRGEVLLAALKLVLSGGVYVPPLMMETVSSAGQAGKPRERSPRSGSGAPTLTDRQLEVLRLVGRGLTNREIADVLGIGAATVKTHTLAIYAALDVTNRAEAVMVMRDLGLEDSGSS
jgi:DNA-binding NarL/FixJ family response regulator